MRSMPISALLLAACGLASLAALAGCGGAVATDDGLKVALDSAGRVSAGTGAVMWNGGGAFELTEFLGNGRERRTALAGQVRSAGPNAVAFASRPTDHLRLTATIAGGPFIDIRGRLTADDDADHAIRVTFELPCEGPADGTQAPASARPAALPWLARGGVALAVPMHEPRLFNFERPNGGRPRVSFLLGLSPATAKFPSTATFRLVVYRTDSANPQRSAAARYYEFFPELVASRSAEHGGWAWQGIITRDRWPADRLERYAVRFISGDYQWYGYRLPADLAKLFGRYPVAVLQAGSPFAWREPATTQPDDARDAAANSWLLDAAGRPIQGPPADDGARAVPMNLDPELPAPNWFAWSLAHVFANVPQIGSDGFPGPTGVAVLGLDDPAATATLNFNFRRDHFASADFPLVCDPASGRVAEWAAASDFEGLAALAAKVHAGGGLVLADASPAAAMLLAPLLDVVGSARSIDEATLDELERYRLIAGPRPVSFFDSHYSERSLARAALFGVFPGNPNAAIDGSAGRYLPAMRRMASAGWQPISRCTVAPDALRAERFGRPDAPTVYLAVHNPTDKPVEAAVASYELTMHDDRDVRELVHGLEVRRVPDAGLDEVRPDTLKLAVPAGATAILEFARPAPGRANDSQGDARR